MAQEAEETPSLSGYHIRRGLGQIISSPESISGYHVRRGFGEIMASVLGCGVSSAAPASVDVTPKFLSLYQVRFSFCDARSHTLTPPASKLVMCEPATCVAWEAPIHTRFGARFSL
jgi:hypothetical protein